MNAVDIIDEIRKKFPSLQINVKVVAPTPRILVEDFLYDDIDKILFLVADQLFYNPKLAGLITKKDLTISFVDIYYDIHKSIYESMIERDPYYPLPRYEEKIHNAMYGIKVIINDDGVWVRIDLRRDDSSTKKNISVYEIIYKFYEVINNMPLSSQNQIEIKVKNEVSMYFRSSVSTKNPYLISFSIERPNDNIHRSIAKLGLFETMYRILERSFVKIDNLPYECYCENGYEKFKDESWSKFIGFGFKLPNAITRIKLYIDVPEDIEVINHFEFLLGLINNETDDELTKYGIKIKGIKFDLKVACNRKETNYPLFVDSVPELQHLLIIPAKELINFSFSVLSYYSLLYKIFPTNISMEEKEKSYPSITLDKVMEEINQMKQSLENCLEVKLMRNLYKLKEDCSS